MKLGVFLRVCIVCVLQTSAYGAHLPLSLDADHLLIITPAHIPEDGVLCISNMESLQKIFFREGNYQKLSELLISDNNSLTRIQIPKKGYYTLENLVITNNPSLAHMRLPDLDKLETLVITSNPPLIRMHLPNLTKLRILHVNDNDSLESLDVTPFQKLRWLYVKNNKSLVNFMISDSRPADQAFAELEVESNPSLPNATIAMIEDLKKRCNPSFLYDTPGLLAAMRDQHPANIAAFEYHYRRQLRLQMRDAHWEFE